MTPKITENVHATKTPKAGLRIFSEIHGRCTFVHSVT